MLNSEYNPSFLECTERCYVQKSPLLLNTGLPLSLGLVLSLELIFNLLASVVEALLWLLAALLLDLRTPVLTKTLLGLPEFCKHALRLDEVVRWYTYFHRSVPRSVPK